MASSLYSLHSVVMNAAANIESSSTISPTGTIQIESKLPPPLDTILQQQSNFNTIHGKDPSPSESLLKALFDDVVIEKTAKENDSIKEYYDSNSTNGIIDTNDSCTLYLAPSTIPGAGLGIFAGNITHYNVDAKVGRSIPSIVTTPDLVVPLIDMAWHNDLPEFSKNEFLWDEYTWDSDSFKGMTEPDKTINGASFGYGAIPNSLQAITNAKDAYGTIFDYHPDQSNITSTLDNEDYHDEIHNMDELIENVNHVDNDNNDNDNIVTTIGPGYGAYTPFYNRTGIAKRIIKPGEEIFINYGESYFNDRTKTYGYLPLQKTYTEADKLLATYYDISDELEATNVEKKSIQQDYNITKVFYEMIQSVLALFPSPISTLVTSLSLEELDTVGEKYGSVKYRYAERSVRDISWLQQHGSCMDKLIVQTSTIPHAGRGAFAKRSIAPDEVIAPIPVIHIPNRTVLNMYGGYIVPNSLGNRYTRNVSDLIHYQLLLNYCFGHKDSTMLLCPYGVASSAINHAPTPDQINAKLQWNFNLSSHPEWLEQPLSEWVYKYKSTGLVMDYIATRPIAAGEEVLIDYGIEWQTAWENHVLQWNKNNKQQQLQRPIPSRVLNRKLQFDQLELPTVREVWEYTDLHLYCRNIYPYFTDATFFQDRYRKKLLHNDEVEEHTDVALPCRIISKVRSSSSGTNNLADDEKSQVLLYTVELLYLHHAHPEDQGDEDRDYVYDDDTEEDEFYTEVIDMCYEKRVGVVFGIPSSHIFFGTAVNWYDVIYDRSYHNRNSFRHDLRIPDTIMPDAWKNLQTY